MSTLDEPVQEPTTGKARIGNFYFLPRGMLSIEGAPATDSGFTVTLSKKNEPDHAARYFLKQNWHPAYSDATTLEVDENGLLTTSNVSSEDQSPAIIDKVTETLINVAKIGANLGGGIPGIQALEETKPGTFLPFKVSFDPLDSHAVSVASAEMFKSGLILKIDDHGVPMGKDARSAGSGRLSTGGVYYRPPATVGVKITSRPGFPARIVMSESVRIPDPANIGVLDFSRPILVKKTINVTFAAGDLKKLEYIKPSEALAFVSIPASVTGKIAEAIPDIIKVHDARANAGLAAEKARLDAQKEVLDAQLALTKSKQALAAGVPAAAPTAASAPGGRQPMTVEERRSSAQAALKAAKNAEIEAENQTRRIEIERIELDNKLKELKKP